MQNMKAEDLVGFWRFKSNQIRAEDGTWFDDPISGGNFAFSKAKSFCVFFRSMQGAWGFSGKYDLVDNILKLSLDAAMTDDMNHANLERRLTFTSSNEFTYEGMEYHTGRGFKAVLVRE